MATHLQKTITVVFDPTDGNSHHQASTYCGLSVPLSRVNQKEGAGKEQYLEMTGYTNRMNCEDCRTAERLELR